MTGVEEMDETESEDAVRRLQGEVNATKRHAAFLVL
jgi:hypothetical protein